MSCHIKQDGGTAVVVLDGEMLIQHAAEFYQAVLPLAGFDGAVRVEASASRSIHTSIIQILHALSRAAPDFAVIDASAEFRAAELRVGLAVSKHNANQSSDRPARRA